MVSGSLAAIEMLSAILSDKKSNAVLPSSLRIHFDKTKSQSRVPYVTIRHTQNNNLTNNLNRTQILETTS